MVFACSKSPEAAGGEVADLVEEGPEIEVCIETFIKMVLIEIHVWSLCSFNLLTSSKNLVSTEVW